MFNLPYISRIGLGTYRMSVKNPLHLQALDYAISNKLNLVDTSSNYTDGASELLIGKYLSEYPEHRKNIFLITKAGYITKGNLLSFKEKIVSQEIAHVSINENFKYSLHPDYLKIQIETSLKRLNTKNIDCFLLHNPEHYFRVEHITKKEVYRIIKLAFTYLEELRKDGLIKYYGVSSNTLPTPDKQNGISLSRLLEIANGVSADNGFKFIQFPFNLLENDAQEINYKDKSLIKLANEAGVRTISNRPLNAFHNGSFLRLAEYPIAVSKTDLDKKDYTAYQNFINSISTAIKKVDAQADIYEYAPIKNLRDYRKKFGNPEAVIHFNNHDLFPFLSVVFDDTIPEDILASAKVLRECSTTYSKILLNEKLHVFKATLLEKNVLSDSTSSLPLAACQSYFDNGIDHILMGLRKKEYIDQMLPFIKT